MPTPKTLADLRNSVIDYARPNHFEISITGLPDGLDKNFGESDPSNYLKTITTPTSNISTIAINHLGRKIEYPGDFPAGEMQAIFRCDLGMNSYQLFKDWQGAIIGHADNIDGVGDNPAKSFNATVVISQLSHIDNEKVFEWKILNAWPAGLTEISFDMEADASILEFTVTFQYSHLGTTWEGYQPSESGGALGALIGKLF